jgi:L-rhamnose-H+ transport protein
MMNLTLGIVLAVVAGSMNGLFAFPMKANREWVWENNWLPFSILSLALFPWFMAWLTIPQLRAAFSHVTLADGLQATCWGFLCYSGSLLFGLSTDRIGIGLSFALLIGAMTVVGVLGPYAIYGTLLHSAGGGLILGGVALSIVSVILGCLATPAAPTLVREGKATQSRSWLGILFAVLGGALSGLLPIAMGMPWSLRIQSAAQVYGLGGASRSSNAVLALILFGGAIPNCGYCFLLLARKGTFHRYQDKARPAYWLGILLMATLYSSSVALWGISISPRLLGPLGPSLGWALFVGTIVISSTAASLFSGEWKRASHAALRKLALSIASLTAGMVLICLGNYLNLNGR